MRKVEGDRRSAGRTPLCCVVVEDQTMFLQLLVGMLRTLPGIEVTAAAATMREGIAACRSVPVDLLILDLGLPDGHGLDVLRAAVEARPRVGCIILSAAASEFTCPQGLLGNLLAVIDKAEAYDQLQSVVSAVAGARGTGRATGQSGVSVDKLLRPRELEVFRLVGQGLTTDGIAAALGISRHTVETHRKRIAAKLDARGADLVRLATIHNQTALPAVALPRR